MADALKLPSGDFPATLAMWTLLSYPVAWLFGIAIIGLIVYALLLVAGGLAGLSTQPIIDPILRLISRAFAVESRWRKFIEDGRQALIGQALRHAVGAAVMTVFVAMAASFWLQGIHQPRLVRLFSYVADYERAPAYPGVEKEKFRLHDNGVVSYATYNAGDVAIRVENVDVQLHSPH